MDSKVEITREWLDEVSDENGLTRGQQQLLQIHLGEPPYVGREIDPFVHRFIGKCKGYRGMSKELRDLISY